MDDQKILDLFFSRSPQAVAGLSQTYGPLLLRLAERILGNPRDAEECVNDAYLGIWDRIPPERPQPLRPYVCRVVRNLALKRYHWNRAKKRDSGFDAAYSEMEECLGVSQGPEEEQDAKELKQALETFLDSLPQEDRVLFLRRYWFGDSHAETAARLGITENNAAVRLSRIRRKLRAYLKENGVIE